MERTSRQPEAVSFIVRDPSLQLDPPIYIIRVSDDYSIKELIQSYCTKSLAIPEHLRLKLNDQPLTTTAPDGTLNTLADFNIKNKDVVAIFHRHGKICRFCKRMIRIKLKSSGFYCAYDVSKAAPIQNIIDSFKEHCLTSTENMRYKYMGQEFDLKQPDGKLTTPLDLKMGDGDSINIVNQRNFR